MQEQLTTWTNVIDLVVGFLANDSMQVVGITIPYPRRDIRVLGDRAG